MALEIARANGQARDLAPVEPMERIAMLDTYSAGLSEEGPRVDALATISAGRRGPSQNGKPGLPQRSTDGTIYLHDPDTRAPGLKAALEATESKRLTIAFPVDQPAAFLQQRFLAYSASALLAYGDALKMTVIENGVHSTYDRGTPDYKRAVSICKAVFSLYFTLADYDANGRPLILWPDGMGFYRLRSTSRHSLSAIVGQLEFVRTLTKGQLAGIPFELSLTNKEVAGPDGVKRRIPCWSLVHRPPSGLVLDAARFRQIALAARDHAGLLQLPAPSQESIETVAIDQTYDIEDPSVEDLALLARGGRCNAAHYEKTWFAIVNGSDLDSDEARADFLGWCTNGVTRSLKEFLERATDDDAQLLINEVSEYVLDRKQPRAPSFGVLDRNAFIATAMEKFGYGGHLEIAHALGVKPLNAWLDGGKTWNDAWAELEKIEAAKETLRHAEDVAYDAGRAAGPPTVAEYEQGWVDDEAALEPMPDADRQADAEEAAALANDSEPEPNGFDALVAEHQAAVAAQPSDVSELHALWLDYGQNVSIAESLGITIGPKPPKSATIEQLRGFHRALGRKVEQAQRQASFR